MPRRKPVSGKQHKAELQIKRAIKRGDAPPPTALAATSAKSKGKGRPVPGRSFRFGNAEERQEDSRRLQSAFTKLSAEFLEDAKLKASTLPLPRPIPPENAIYPTFPEATTPGPARKLTIIRRPKWNYEMNKKQVEKNEEGVFKKWIKETDETLQTWVTSQNNPELEEEEEEGSQSASEPPMDGISTSTDPSMPIAPPLYERNLEVWRQLWRVTEICEILLVLLDSRCPLLHYPPSLQQYLSTFKQPRKVIFILTKTDISGPTRSKAWSTYLSTHYPENSVLLAESYREKRVPAAPGQGQRKHLEPHLPSDLRLELIQALKTAHEELSRPPPGIVNDETKVRAWKPRVKQNIDWDSLTSADSFPIDEEMTEPDEEADFTATVEDDKSKAPNFLSIGLIGQPNVGKSSLLNALFGTNKVKASKTPGKTKHFQSHFLTKNIRLVDCPGLVFPNFVSQEFQVLAGILPVSQVSAIPSCVYYASLHLPLEAILRLNYPEKPDEKISEDKRTWRAGTNRITKAREVSWTAMDIMSSYAQSKGWITAKAGRPDVNRAGNSILRALAEGKVKWSFLPSPGGDTRSGHAVHDDFSKVEGRGIWIAEEDERPTIWDSDDDSTKDKASEDDDSSLFDLSEVDDHDLGSPLEVEEEKDKSARGMFAALSMDDSEDDNNVSPEDE
ncbi:P-loop containing nucleoside triphosphate hydrolase protein [Schizopora paradoxa]|uniref:Guanine nucleotide-binding protein-like 1 n=1 Tax=Schizopora paradoxa TaxID=27342 RepID=A0A0H2S001_9AGAM|nr:P-loop containing nucleoside triphosphate hydrolase protein [Schizopora paradoxa]